MAYTEHSPIDPDGEIQPDSELVYHHTGLIEGHITIKYDINNEPAALALIGPEKNHPDDPNVMYYAARVRYLRNNYILVTYDCIGIAGTRQKTIPVLLFPNTVTTEPIESHPFFRRGISASQLMAPAPLAGYGDVNAKSSNAQGRTQKDGGGDLITNDSRFQMSDPHPTTGKRTEEGFLGFGAGAPKELQGVRSYYQAAIMCNLTYYTEGVPTLKTPTTIQEPAGEGVVLPTIEGINQWMHLVSSCEQVGKVNIWRVTEQYISGTRDRISERIYPTGNQPFPAPWTD